MANMAPFELAARIQKQLERLGAATDDETEGVDCYETDRDACPDNVTESQVLFFGDRQESEYLTQGQGEELLKLLNEEPATGGRSGFERAWDLVRGLTES